jgi:adenylate cyclase
VVVDGGDLFGGGVDIAFRLESLAEPGGLLVSEDVDRQVKHKRDLVFTDALRQLDT